MAQPVGALRVDLSASSAKFQADMKKAKNAVKQNASGMSAAMETVKKKFNDTATAINRFGGYAVLGAATAMAVFVKKQIDVADKMGKLAQQTGTTSEYLSGMALVASQAGTTLETIAKGTQRLSMNMNDMKRGVGESKETFELLNIKVAESSGTLRNSEDVMKDIADKFAKMEDGADKTAAAMRIFGRAGAELIPMLNMGSAGIEQLQKKAQEMGLVISHETAMQAAYLNDQLDIMKGHAVGAGRSMALDLIPWLNETLAVMKLAKEEAGFLMAGWVGLGAIGDALFGSSTQQKINKTRTALERLQQLQKDSNAQKGINIIGFGVSERDIQELKTELASLEAQKQREDAADKSRMEASMKRYSDEADARRKNTEDMIKAMEAKVKAEEAASKAAIEKDKLLKDQQSEEIQRQRELEASEKQIADRKEKLHQLTVDQYIQDEADKFAALEQYEKDFADKQAEIAAEKARLLEEELDKEKQRFDELKRAIEGWGRDSADAIVKFARTGEMSFRQMIDSMINDLLRMMVYQSITGPLFGAVSGSLFGSAHGNAFQGGNVIPFARGGIVDRPTIFPMARGAGLMGEAGAEAILPLARTSGGDLGVKTQAAGGDSQSMNVNVAITAVDAASFQDLMRRNPGLIVEPIVTALTSQGHRPLINAVKGVM